MAKKRRSGSGLSNGLSTYLDEALSRHSGLLYAIFRSGTGLFFLLHGLDKIGITGQAQPLFSLLWFAGAIETAVGLGLLLGFMERVAALLGAATMVAAYALVHLPKGLEGLKTGELAILYFLAFLGIMSRTRK